MRVASRSPRSFVSARGLTAAAAVAAATLLVTGAPASAHPASARASAAPTSTDLYVNSETGSGCSDAGHGTQTQPFCTIAAAAAVAQPGQTVLVHGGDYAATTISVSGTTGAPVTFRADTTAAGPLARVNTSGTTGAGLVVSGVHDVVLSGFDTFASRGGPAIEISNSSDVTVDGGSAHGAASAGMAGILVTGTSANVTIRGVSVTGTPGVEVDAGVTAAVVASSTIATAHTSPGVLVTDAPGAEVTGNTVLSSCASGVVLAGDSAGASVENNIVEAAASSGKPACTGTDAAGIDVAAAAAAGTTSDYNLIDPASATPLYSWAGTSYATVDGFTAATGQGAHDIAASPGLGTATGGDDLFFPLTSASPAVDSADASAPGEPATDALGDARADDPAVANPGTGLGYFDRGAAELEGPVTAGVLSVSRAPASGPLAVTATAPITTAWVTNGPLGTDSFTVSGSQFPVLASPPSASLMLTGTGENSVRVEQVVPGVLDATASTSVVVGAGYTPVTPTRILDTRNGTGAAKGAIAAGGTVTVTLPSQGAVPASGISAAALNVTVTQPSATGWVSVFPPGGSGSGTSNLNFAAGQTVANLVTATVAGGQVSFHNGGGGTVQVVADLDGFYSAVGDGLAPQTPARVLDTRAGTGAPAQAVAAEGTLALNLAGRVPAGAAAAVLNVTVTQPKAAGFLTAFGDGQAVPTASSLNFTSGQTVANLVIVPLVNGKADFFNGSGGTVQLVGDLEGYFAAAAPDTYVPFGPDRIADTRTAGGPVAANGTVTITPASFNCGALCPAPAAAVINVTATQPQAAGFLTVYPSGQTRPASSAVSFAAGKTVAGLVTAEVGGGGSVTVFNGSGGTVQIVADEQGYYIGS